jgi:ABC-type transporter Mla subunit MlaD
VRPAPRGETAAGLGKSAVLVYILIAALVVVIALSVVLVASAKKRERKGRYKTIIPKDSEGLLAKASKVKDEKP